jgi:tetratricopeptide (TPR) repeat protein
MANNLGVLLGRVGQLQRAAQAYEQGIAATASSGGARDHALMSSYARLLIDLGRAGEALPILERATAASERDGDPLFAALGVFGSASAQCQLHRWQLCDRLLVEARARLKPVVPRERALWGSLEVVAAKASLARGDAGLAERQLHDAVALYEAAEDRSVGRVRAFSLLARVEAQRGDLVAAQIDADRALQLARSETAGFARSEWVGSALLAQGAVAKARGDAPAAKAALGDALEHLRPTAGVRAPATREAVALLASLS